MKININLIFTCVLFIAFSKNVQGGFVSGIVEKIHNTVHKINEDVHNILLPKEKNNQDVTGDNKQKEIKSDTADTGNPNNENSRKITPTTETTETTENVKNNKNPVIATSIKPHDGHNETELKEGTTEESFVFVTSSSTVAPVSSTTVKEGRENFAAGCSTGYKRTSDGRCKPTFR